MRRALGGDRTQLLLPPHSATGTRLLAGFAVALVAPIVATVISHGVEELPSVPYILAVIAATLVGRLLAGLVAALASTLLIHYYFIPPLRSFGKLSESLLETLLFFIVGIVVAALLAHRDRARAEAQWERDRFRFLSEASEVLGGSLNYERTLEELARQVVPFLADWCAIDIVNERGDIENAATAHVDPSKVEMARELRERYPTDPRASSGAPNVIRTGRSELTAEIPDALLREVAPDQEQLRILRTLGLYSAMVVPLPARDGVLGAMTLVNAESRRTFTEHDLVLAEELAGRAGIAVDNARLYRQRAQIARTLQQGLLPKALPEIPGLELDAYFLPGFQGQEVGGDFYDAFEMRDGSWALVIGDVCGKGARAASVSGSARATMRAIGLHGSGPCEILGSLNDTMPRDEGSLFCTASFARFERHREGFRIVVCIAGHPLPLILRSDGRVEPVGEPGSLLGVHSHPTLADVPAELFPGDALLLYTDGLEGRGTTDLFGASGTLTEAIASPGKAGDVTDAIRRYVADLPPEETKDDVAVLVALVSPQRRGTTRPGENRSAGVLLKPAGRKPRPAASHPAYGRRETIAWKQGQ